MRTMFKRPSKKKDIEGTKSFTGDDGGLRVQRRTAGRPERTGAVCQDCPGEGLRHDGQDPRDTMNLALS